MVWRLLLAVCLVVLAGAAQAQEEDGRPGQAALVPVLPPPILIVDLERLYSESDYGQRIELAYQAELDTLRSEAAATQGDLEAEELLLAEQRPNMEIEAFREAAEAFDMKVEALREDIDSRGTAVAEARDAGRDGFMASVRPLLQQILEANQALVMVEAQNTYLFDPGIDITEDAIAFANRVLGDGTDAE